MTINEVRDEKISDSNSSADEEKVKDMEGKQILKNIKDSDYVISGGRLPAPFSVLSGSVSHGGCPALPPLGAAGRGPGALGVAPPSESALPPDAARGAATLRVAWPPARWEEVSLPSVRRRRRPFFSRRRRSAVRRQIGRASCRERV